MANLFETGQLTMYNDRMQMFGLGSKLDVKAILDAELEVLKLRQLPYENQKKTLATEKEVWGTFKGALNAFSAVSEKLKFLSANTKQVSFSEEKFVQASAGADALDTSYSVSVERLATKHRVMGDKLGTGPLGYSGQVSLNGKSLDVTGDMGLKDVASAINKGGYGAGAVVLDGRLVLTSNNSGSGGKLVLADLGGADAVWNALGVLDGSDLKHEMDTPEDARFTINGIPMTSSSNTVTEVDGLTLTLLKETEGDVTMTVARSNDAARSALEDFVKTYNSIVLNINKLTAKDGAMQGETVLNQLKRKMGDTLMAKTDSPLYLFNLGVRIDADAKDGTIKFDAASYGKTLSERPEEIMKILSGENAIGAKMTSMIHEFTKATGSISNKIKGIDEKVGRIDDNLERLDSQFERQKQSLLKKYAMLEITLSGLNITADYMKGQLQALLGNGNNQ